MFYWYSAKQNNVRQSTGKPVLIAPNGEFYTCNSSVPDAVKCCGKWDDIELVCKTYNNVVVFSPIGITENGGTQAYIQEGITSNWVDSIERAEFDSKSWRDHVSSNPEQPELSNGIILVPLVPGVYVPGTWADTMSVFRIGPPKTKTDTVIVALLCQQYTKSSPDSPINWTTGDVKIECKTQERQLEWETWNGGVEPDRYGTAVAINIIKSDWVVKSIRWLDPIDGCYQLIPARK